ncbi:MAG TPA: cytosine permease [Polyangiaceae bacterium]|nr:cytosine permease [Polyangiaceae bacterium]
MPRAGCARRSEETTPGNATAFQRERHGLEPIPPSERRGAPGALFWTWLGGTFNYVALAAGALPILFGLGLRGALLAAAVGNTLGAIVFALCAMPGPRTGTATIVNTRAALGHVGNLPAAAVSFLSVSGWVAVNSTLASLALIQLLTAAGVAVGAMAKALVIAGVLVVQMVIAIYGHATIMAMERVFGVASAVLLSGVLFFVLPRVNWSAPSSGQMAGSTAWGTWLLALGAMFAIPLSWANYAADYARYLPENTDVKRVALYSGLGLWVGNMACSALGVLLATLVDMRDPLANVPRVLPTWYLVPFLAAVLWGTVANNVMNLYTAGLGLLALRIRARREVAVLILGVGAGALTYIAIFIYNFIDLFTQLLSLTLIFLSPWAAILVVDYALRRGRYDAVALHAWGRGPYWFTRGVNGVALGVYALGMAAALATSSSPLWASPLMTKLTGGADLSLFVGFLLTGALYAWVARTSIRQQTAQLLGNDAPEPIERALESR